MSSDTKSKRTLSNSSAAFSSRNLTSNVPSSPGPSSSRTRAASYLLQNRQLASPSPSAASGPFDICPGCRMPFDKGRKRKLVDTCGHERCYACMFRNEACPLCFAPVGDVGGGNARPGGRIIMQGGFAKKPSFENRMVFGSGRAAQGNAAAAAIPVNPSMGGLTPSRGVYLHNGVKAGGAGNGGAGEPSSQHSHESGFQSATSLSSLDPASGMVSPSAQPASSIQHNHHHNHNHNFPAQTSRSSTLSPTPNALQGVVMLPSKTMLMPKSINNNGLQNRASSISAANGMDANGGPGSSAGSVAMARLHHRRSMTDSLGSLDSNGSPASTSATPPSHQTFGNLPIIARSSRHNCASNNSNNNQLRHQQVQTQHYPAPLRGATSTCSGSDDGGGSRLYGSRLGTTALQRNSVSGSGLKQQQYIPGQFSGSMQFRQPHWTLKPLFFEVPTTDAHPIFVGRAWLYREVCDHLQSDLPTNKGVIIAGSSGSGKTSVILHLVEHSCFGRDDVIYQDAQSLVRCSSPSALNNSGSLPGCATGNLVNQHQSDGVDSIYSVQTSLAGSTGCHLAGRGGKVNDLAGGGSFRTLTSQVVAYHFCQADNAPTCMVPEFVHSVAAQMSQAPQLTPYYQLIVSDTRVQQLLSLSGCVADPNVAFIKGILEPLDTLKRQGKLASQTVCLLVVDGLCEAEIHRPDYGDTIGSFIARHLHRIPDWLKLVCTVRSNLQETTKQLPFQTISLDKTDVDERLNKDMTDYIAFRVGQSPAIQANIVPVGCSTGAPASGPSNTASSASSPSPKASLLEGTGSSPQARFVAFLASASKGCFLYTKMTLDLIERGHLVIKSSSFNVLPVTLSEIFMLEFNLRFPTSRAFDRVRDILSIVLASLVPMTALDIFNAANSLVASSAPMFLEEIQAGGGALARLFKPLEWGEFLMRFSGLSGFLVRRVDETVMFFHPSLRDWLIRRDRPNQPKFLCDPRVGHAALALWMSTNNGAPLSPESTLELGHHILKAHIYKNSSVATTLNCDDDFDDPGRAAKEDDSIPARDLHAIWVAMASGNVSLSLAMVRNIASPNVKVSKLLLLAGASPDHISECLNQAPLIAVYSHLGHVDMVATLMEFGADVNATNTDGVGALAFAAARGHLDVVRVLLQGGAVVNAVDSSDASPLVVAARNGHLGVVGHLVDNCEWFTDSVHDLGLQEAAQQATVAAASEGHEQVLEFLLDMPEVDANKQDTLTGETGLTAASSRGQLRCAEILLRRGAKVYITNLQESPPLTLAVQAGNWQVTDLLLKEGAAIDQRDARGRTPIMAAAQEGHVGIVELLANRGGKSAVEDADHSGKSALAWAAAHGQVRVAATLLKLGADVNHTDREGKRPLDHAVTAGANFDSGGGVETVRLLLDNGALMEHTDLSGMRALDRAIETGNASAVQAFLRKGSKLGPSTWALAINRPHIMLILLNKLLEDGNTLYRKGRHQEAAHRYNYAIRRLPVNNNNNNVGENNKAALAVDDDDDDVNKADNDDDETETFERLRLHLLLNLSRCQRKLGDWEAAERSATDVIDSVTKTEQAHLAALHARAKARQGAGRRQEAVVDLTSALKLSPNNRDIHRLIMKVKEGCNDPDQQPDSNHAPVGAASANNIKYFDETQSEAGSASVC